MNADLMHEDCQSLGIGHNFSLKDVLNSKLEPYKWESLTWHLVLRLLDTNAAKSIFWP